MSKDKSVIPMLPMAKLLELKVEELLAYAQAAVKTGDKAKSFTDSHKATFSSLGKVIAALKKRFNTESSKGDSLVSALTFSEYYEMKAGGKVNNHANECSRTYGFFVETSLIEEKDYDVNPTNNLEQAARLLTAVKGDVTHDATLKAAEILKERPKDAAKQLANLVISVEGPKKIDAEKAKEMLKTIFESGHMELTLAFTGAEIRSLDDEEMLERAFQHLTIAMDGCGTPEMQDKWMAAAEAAAAPPNLKSPQTESSAETPATEADVEDLEMERAAG
ncbi:MAG: hypothetical protein K9N62_07880 [Verrucomicrobia bacterium]|nr:hypothetical protein [Verrucomicrobiota bacterium]